MKARLALIASAVCCTTAFAATDAPPARTDDSATMEEYVVAANRAHGTEAVGVMDTFVVAASRVEGNESVGVLDTLVVVAKPAAPAKTAAKNDPASARDNRGPKTPAPSNPSR